MESKHLLFMRTRYFKPGFGFEVFIPNSRFYYLAFQIRIWKRGFNFMVIGK